jgi:uncharacterized protein YcnI
MRSNTRAPSRALISVAIAATMMGGLGAATASAHVRVDADETAPGSYAVLTFKVPNESENGSLTTQLSVALPNMTSVSTETMPGWTARLDRDLAAGTVRSVSWTAAPGTGIGADQFALFKISVKLPDAPTIRLPATQTYSDGTIVKWDQPTPPGGEEPEHPAPELVLTDAPAGDHPTPSAAPPSPGDDSARWLAGGALAVAAIALVTALLVRRRA